VTQKNKLAVIVHENDEVTIKDGRGRTLSCKDCRFSGWLTKTEYRQNKFPTHCLYFSGGANPIDKDRVIRDDINYWSHKSLFKDDRLRLEKKYPKCHKKNADGKCEDYVKAKPLSMLNPLRWLGRSFRTLKMRD
jgi:hypothetical protein